MTSVLLVSQPTVAGAAQCVLDWARGLAQHGWQVAVACPSDGWLRQSCADADILTFDWEAVHDPHRGLVSEARALRSILASFNPDVVHLNGAKAGLVGRGVIRGRTPTAFSPHSWAVAASDGIKGKAALRWERIASRWTDVVVAVSDGEQAEGEQLGIKGPYVVARNGVHVDEVTPLPPAQREAVRAKLGLASDEIAVVCVGRLHRQKGQDVLLVAWPAAAAADRRLFLVGDGPLEDQWRSRNTRADVVFTGGVDRRDAVTWMQAADLLVAPSRWEGMALVPLESLAVGTPVISSDVTGAREAVASGCGLLVEPENPVALAEAINAWLSQDVSALASARVAARTRAAAHFNIADTVATISDTLAGLVSPAR